MILSKDQIRSTGDAVEFDRRALDTRAIINVTGRLVASSHDRELLRLRRTVFGLVDEGSSHVVLDVNRVADIDADGLGTLAAIYKTVVRLGGSLTLVGSNPRLRKLLAVTRLDTFMPLVPHGAVAAYGTAALGPLSSFLERAGQARE